MTARGVDPRIGRRVFTCGPRGHQEPTPEERGIVAVYTAFLRSLATKRDDPQAWRERWAFYARGLADGPTSPQEYRALLTAHHGDGEEGR